MADKPVNTEFPAWAWFLILAVIGIIIFMITTRQIPFNVPAADGGGGK